MRLSHASSLYFVFPYCPTFYLSLDRSHTLIKWVFRINVYEFPARKTGSNLWSLLQHAHDVEACVVDIISHKPSYPLEILKWSCHQILVYRALPTKATSTPLAYARIDSTWHHQVCDWSLACILSVFFKVDVLSRGDYQSHDSLEPS